MQAKKNIWPINIQQARSAMILRGTSLNRWAKSHGYSSAYIHLTLTGQRSGPKSRKIVNELLSEIRQSD